jgi:hypothetical protein
VTMNNQNGSPNGSLTCALCLDLAPTHRPTARWRFNVAENLLIESALLFAFSDLEVSSQTCAFCSVIKTGIEIISRGVLRAELRRLGNREASIIVQNNTPVEVKVLGEGGNEEESVRLQFFVKDGK